MVSWKEFCRTVLALFLLLAASPALPASQKDIAEGPVNIEADSITYYENEDTVQAAGKVVITFSRGFLKADTVMLNRVTNMAIAEGQVLVRSDQDVLEGEKVLFNVVTKTGTATDGKIFVALNHLYVEGEKIDKKGEATYRLENATVTTCDGKNPDWRIACSELDLTIDGYGVLKHGRFLTGDLPVFYMPYFVFPAKTTRQSGLLPPVFAFSRDKNGTDVELPFFWAISERVDATLYQRYMEKRGYKQGVEFRYFLSPETFGTLYADFINDRKRVTETIGSMSRDWQEDRNRWSFYLNHETTFASGFNLRSDIRHVSDQWYFRDFTSYNYYLSNYSQSGETRFRRISFLGDESLGSLNSTVRLTKDWSLYNLTALASYTDDFSSQNNNATTLQTYPAVTVTGFRQALFKSPLQLEFNATYVHFYRQEGQMGHLWELNPTLYLPISIGPYAQATTQAGFRGSVWERTDSETDTGDKYGNRQVFPFGASLSTEINRIFVVGSPEKVGIEKIKHAIRPEISYNYNYVPKNESQERGPDFLTRYGFQNSMTYSLTNTLVSRTRGADGKISYNQFLRLLLSQTYDLLESRREVTGIGGDIRRPFSDVNVELDLTPLPNFTLQARNVYSVNYSAWQASNYDLTVYDNRGDRLSLGYRNTQSLGYDYKQTVLEEVNLYLKASVTSSLDAIYILRKNLLDRKTIESTYGIRYRKQCWSVELRVSSLENDMIVMAYFSLLGLGGGAVPLPGASLFSF
ncbi:MAG: LPS-assembly protein LptD [Deltaproteobacteria bacterium]|nr:MAG: LPS-assembly protein LptD [Deltaproteobacteria bacterium]